MTRVCLVKQNTTYDLYKVTGPDLRAIVESSNFRSGPVGLWEAFTCDFRVVFEDPAPECQLGKSMWQQYVVGWDLWPEGYTAERADDVDWSAYDIVICVDVAVPSRIVRRFPEVLWCYYLIERGAGAIRSTVKGSPFYSYNVFLSQELAKSALAASSLPLRSLHTTRRAVLPVPYYLQSSRSISRLYADQADAEREGICLSDHSAAAASDADLRLLEAFGTVRTPKGVLADVLEAKVRSKYFVIHPDSGPRCGNALIEAVSAGCLAVAPSRLQWGYPELVSPGLDFETTGGLLRVLERLEGDAGLYARELAAQRSRVDAWCFSNPCADLANAVDVFRQSKASVNRQRSVELVARASASGERKARSLARRLLPGRS